MRCSKLIGSLLILALVGGCGADGGPEDDGVIDPVFQPIQVLDGDTYILGTQVVRLAGFDAPELAPRAECWAEAALATRAMKFADERLNGNGVTWRIVDPSGPNAAGHITAHVQNQHGDDLGDDLVVLGVAARSDDWDWCGPAQDFEDEGHPTIWTGPNLDPRAFD